MTTDRIIDINKLPADTIINFGVGKLVLEADKINLAEWLELRDSALALTRIIEEELTKQSPEVKASLGITDNVEKKEK